jgi:uncharacterized protein (DUF2384 family)
MKKTKQIKIKPIEETPNVVSEPALYYNTVKKIPTLKEFTYTDFKKIADKAPFNISEWASILHVSERTLQRYAKNNSSFAPINAERISLIETILKEAKITFGKLDNFYNWLNRNPYMLEGNISIQSLATYDGIQQVLTQMGRIKRGITA